MEKLELMARSDCALCSHENIIYNLGVSISSMLVVSLHRTVRHYSANACLLPLCQLHGAAVTTVEGVGSTKTRIHPVQVSGRVFPFWAKQVYDWEASST